MNPYGNGRAPADPNLTLGQLADLRARQGRPPTGQPQGFTVPQAPTGGPPGLGKPHGTFSWGPERELTGPGYTTNPTGVAGTLHPGAQPTATRTVPPFGPLFDLIRNPSLPPFERQFRASTNNTWYAPTISPEKPVLFEVGGIVVPPSMHLFVTGYEFKLYRVSGTGNNTVPVDPESMSTILGFDLTINGQRAQRDCQYQLLPVPVSTTPVLFQPRPVAGDKSRGAAVLVSEGATSNFSAPGGAGSSQLPNRPSRMGPDRGPFTLFVAQNEAFAGAVAIMRPLSIPLAFIQFNVTGVMVDRTTANSVFSMTGLK